MKIKRVDLCKLEQRLGYCNSMEAFLIITIHRVKCCKRRRGRVGKCLHKNLGSLGMESRSRERVSFRELMLT